MTTCKSHDLFVMRCPGYRQKVWSVDSLDLCILMAVMNEISRYLFPLAETYGDWERGGGTCKKNGLLVTGVVNWGKKEKFRQKCPMVS